MELIIKSNDKGSIQKIIDFAKKLNVVVEEKTSKNETDEKEATRQRVMNFKATGESSFGDALEWQKEVRKDRDLPFID